MTIQNNHFSTQLQNINRPVSTERTAARGAAASTASTGASTAVEDKAAATPALPAGLVGNHVNTTA